MLSPGDGCGVNGISEQRSNYFAMHSGCFSRKVQSLIEVDEKPVSFIACLETRPILSKRCGQSCVAAVFNARAHFCEMQRAVGGGKSHIVRLQPEN